jgi:hypothetical protein
VQVVFAEFNKFTLFSFCESSAIIAPTQVGENPAELLFSLYSGHIWLGETPVKKLAILSILIFAAFLTACGGGVATVSPPEQTQNYQSAIDTANAPSPTPIPPAEVVVETEVPTEEGGSQGSETLEPTLAPATEVPTELPTESVTEVATEVATEAPTSEVTEVATEAATELPTEIATEAVTEVATELPTEEGGSQGNETLEPTASPTEESTEVATEIATELPTEAATELATTEPTEAVTEIATEAATEAPTSEPTEVVTEAPTEEGGVGGQVDATATPVPTDTLSPTETPAPTETATATVIPTEVPSETLVPTNTPTALPSNTATALPTDTPSPVPTDTLAPTETLVPTNTVVPTDTPSPTDTLAPTLTSTPSVTPFDVPDEADYETYTSEEFNLTMQYPAVWSEPVFDEPFLILSPDGTTDTFPAAAISRGTPETLSEQFGGIDSSSPENFLTAVGESLGEAEIQEVNGYPYPAFELIGGDVDLKARVLLYVVSEEDWILLIGAVEQENFDLYSETIFQQIATSIVAQLPEPTPTSTPVATSTPRATPTLPPTWTPTATPRPILGQTYEDENAGFGFSYPTGAEVSEDDNGVTVEATVEDVPGEVYFVRGKPEELAEQGVICESRDPVETLRCINPAVEPTYTNRYEKFGSPAWFTFQNIEADGQTNAVVSYIVAAGSEWIFIRLTAPAENYTTANLQLFQPMLDSVFIDPPTVDVFGRWNAR